MPNVPHPNPRDLPACVQDYRCAYTKVSTFHDKLQYLPTTAAEVAAQQFWFDCLVVAVAELAATGAAARGFVMTSEGATRRPADVPMLQVVGGKSCAPTTAKGISK